MSSYINLTTGECISGTCQSLESLSHFDSSCMIIFLLCCGIITLILAFLIMNKLKEEKEQTEHNDKTNKKTKR